MGYSYYPVSQDSACAGVMGMLRCMCTVCACTCVYICVVSVTRNPEECYMAFFCQGRNSNSPSGFQKILQ